MRMKFEVRSITRGGNGLLRVRLEAPLDLDDLENPYPKEPLEVELGTKSRRENLYLERLFKAMERGEVLVWELDDPDEAKPAPMCQDCGQPA